MERLTNNEEIIDYMNRVKNGRVDPNEILAKVFEKLKQYEDLEEQGKLLKLHCKAGDIVYALLGVPAPSKYVIYPAEVKEICFGVYGNRRTIKYRLEPMRYRGRILDFYSDDYEKKFFLEESEAESALQKMNEMEGKNGN